MGLLVRQNYDPPRHLCCPTDAFSDLGARSYEVRFALNELTSVDRFGRSEKCQHRK